ncbi:PPDK, partial [Symbiodinium microadriaticum]
TAVLSAPIESYDDVEAHLKQKVGVSSVLDLSEHALEEMVTLFKGIASIPTSPLEQLWLAVNSTFFSIRSDKCQEFVWVHNLSPESATKTAIIIQKMVFGNLNERSGTGVCFSRFVREGGNVYGNYLPMAEGDDTALNDHRKAGVSERV